MLLGVPRGCLDAMELHLWVMVVLGLHSDGIVPMFRGISIIILGVVL